MRITARVPMLLLAWIPLLGAGPVREATVDAVVDRIEDELLVLDVAPHASLAIPRGTSDLSEGEAVTVFLVVGAVAHAPARDAQEWRVVAADASWLRVAAGDPERAFGWPRALAPAVEPGDRLRVRMRSDRARTARRRRELEELRKQALPEP